jgi:O-antigen/teichoic acid export membrane protein
MNSTDQLQTSSHEIGKKVASNAAWNYLSFGVSKALNLVTVSILAHLLTPGLFGVVALATLAIDYISILNDLGLGAALVQRRENIDEASNIAFTFNLLIGIFLTILIVLISPYVAVFFHAPTLTPILRWLGLGFTVNALGSVHKARLQRDLRFGKKLIPELGNTLIKGGLSIGLAFMGYGAWSLVYGQLAGMSISAMLLWIVVPWRPRLLLRSPISGQLFKYGFSVMMDRAFTVFADSFDYLLIGRFFNTAALGIYTLAYRLPDLLILNTLSVLAAVFFPAFSSIQNQQDVLRKSFLSTTRYVQLLVTPLCLGIFVAADPIIRLIFGEQWLQSIPIMQVLSLYTLALSVGFHVGDIYKAVGRPDILLKISLPIFFIRLIALWIGSQYSLIGIAAGHLVAALIEVVIRAVVTINVIKVSLREILNQLTAFIGGIVLLIFAAPVLYLTQDLTPWVRLTFVVISGAVGYLGTIWFIDRVAILKGIGMLGMLAKTPAKASEL